MLVLEKLITKEVNRNDANDGKYCKDFFRFWRQFLGHEKNGTYSI